MATRKPEIAELACACAAVRRTARAVTQLYDETLRAHHIEGAQFALLAMIGKSGECTQASLAERFDFDKTTISRNMRLLARKKWIEFARGEDRRERRVRLTAVGRRRLAAARPAWRAAQDRLRGPMTQGDWNAMLAVLGRVTTAARSARSGSAA
ncbi:MAG: MarR family winged helix-turn-helix transcriptional regulator [Gemmatimonadaceae bacterium]